MYPVRGSAGGENGVIIITTTTNNSVIIIIKEDGGRRRGGNVGAGDGKIATILYNKVLQYNVRTYITCVYVCTHV